MSVRVEIPMRLKNPLNGSREHWAVKSKRAKEQRAAVLLMLKSQHVSFGVQAMGEEPRLGFMPSDRRLSVRLVRVYSGKSQPMDDDGLSAAFKHCRDSVAAYFDIDDADPRIRFECAQERGKENLVRIDFEVVAL